MEQKNREEREGKYFSVVKCIKDMHRHLNPSEEKAPKGELGDGGMQYDSEQSRHVRSCLCGILSHAPASNPAPRIS